MHAPARSSRNQSSRVSSVLLAVLLLIVVGSMAVVYLTYDRTLIVKVEGVCSRAPPPNPKYRGTSQSLHKHQLAPWYESSKFGIMVAWGPYSVPAYAPVNPPEWKAQSEEEWFKLHPGAEWYKNTLQQGESPTWQYHEKKYGQDVEYYDFVPMFDQQLRNWDPEAMGALFADSGARYVIMPVKNHDGVVMFPTSLKHPKLREEQSHIKRDVVGELGNAVRMRGLELGIYFSGGIDWSFSGEIDPEHSLFRPLPPNDKEYAAYADAQLREAIQRYRPALVWGDAGYPVDGQALQIMAEFYNKCPLGAINDRWGLGDALGHKAFEGDFITPAVQAGVHEVWKQKRPWESSISLNGHSLGLNEQLRLDQVPSIDKVIHTMIDVVSKGGNFLLTVAPDASGSIPKQQESYLRSLGLWMNVNKEAIRATKSFNTPVHKTLSGVPVHYTITQNEEILYAILLRRPASSSVTLLDIEIKKGGKVVLLGDRSGEGGQEKSLTFQMVGRHVKVNLPDTVAGSHAFVLKLSLQAF